MGTFKVDGAIVANGKLTSNTTGARLTTDNGTTSIWFGINTDGSAWGIYNIGTSKYILRQTATGTNFYGNSDSATKLATARNFTIGSASAKAFDGTAALTWTHAEIGATVSNSWTAGTTAGPKIVTTVNGVAGTGVAIPAASTAASGVVTTGNQRFRGVKTLEYPTISSNSTQYQGFYYKNSADTVVGDHWLDCGNKTNITKTQYHWRQYSPNSTANTSTTGYYETYYLPACATGLKANKSYEIFTSKSYSTLDGRYLKLSGGTMTGNISFKTTNYTSTPLQVLDDGTDYGHTLIIGAGGTTYVGAGESAGALQSANGTSSAENLYLCADSDIYLVVGCDPIANRKVGAQINTAGRMLLNYGLTVTNSFELSNNNVASSIYSQNSSYLHYSTNASVGHWFNKNTYVQGNIYAGSSYSDLVLTAANYTNYTVTKTGTGASGSWGISITGNASYASSAGYATYLNTVAGNEIRIHNATGLTNGGSLWLGWAWADGNKTVTKDWYIGNFSGGGLANIYAGNFIGAWQGNSPSSFAPASHSHSYLPLSGGTLTGKLQVNAPIFGYNYSSGGNNVASFTWDKPGSNYTGMGACGEADTIYFGACNNDGVWVTNYRQKWKFNGSLIVGGGDDNCSIVPWTNNYSTIGTESLKWWKIYATNIYGDKVYGAVWNDYAEYRSQKEEIKPGYCVASTNSGEVYKTTEKFQACDGIVSDTFGFAIGETDGCKTPLAVAGRVLAYVNGNRADYQAGDTVCAGPDGRICKMSREEIREYPDRIVGIVSEIPDYEVWGSGNIAVDGRIWIKIK